MAYTDDWESLMNGVFGPGGRFKAAPGTSAPKTCLLYTSDAADD